MAKAANAIDKQKAKEQKQKEERLEKAAIGGGYDPETGAMTGTKEAIQAYAEAMATDDDEDDSPSGGGQSFSSGPTESAFGSVSGYDPDEGLDPDDLNTGGLASKKKPKAKKMKRGGLASKKQSAYMLAT